MPTALSLETARRGDGTLVLRAIGELDLSNLDTFRDALEGALAASEDSAPVVVDFSGVEYLDSGAITTLFGFRDRIHLIANRILMPVLTVSGLADEIAVRPAE